MTIKKRFLAALTLTVALLLPSMAKAQDPKLLMTPLRQDSAVRVGHLPNGLTYYIRHNEYPKGQADFYIAQNVGSILEEENQRGLAHFLEHMCFNGTTHFPGTLLRDWLESIGVKFGANLNAATGLETTIYNISNVPVARESVQDSCLLILHDWANDLTLDPEEIDKERGVIHEEWRRHNQGQQRIVESILPDVYPTTKYGRRLPIGLMSVVDSFPPQALRDYYEKWYRPDLQAIIVVGDIDVDRIEGKIKELFSSIEMPENPAKREYEPVPDHEGTLYGIGSDPEMSRYMAQIMFLSDKMPKMFKNLGVNMAVSFTESAVSAMINQRLSEMASKPDAPFNGASVSTGGYLLSGPVKDAFTGSVVAKDNDILKGLQAVYREMLRAQRGGFSESELNRVKETYLSALDRAYAERETRENNAFVNEYVRNFTEGEAIPSFTDEYELAKKIIPEITLESINETMSKAITKDNRVIIVLAPEKEGVKVPTKEEIEKALAEVDAEQITTFVDNVKNEPLIANEPKPGKIKKEVKNEKWGTTEWTLSNGAKVIVKPTDYKKDEIMFTATAKGGYSELGDEYNPSLGMMSAAVNRYGLGSYNRHELGKYLAGKQATVMFGFGEHSRNFLGGTNPKDLPTFMEVLYMAFTAPTFDQEEFDTMKKTASKNLKDQMELPGYIMGKNTRETLYKSARKQQTTPEQIEAANLDEIRQIVKDMTANAADYTFLFVGNVDPQTLKPYVEKYIASLPGNAKKARRDEGEYKEADAIIPGEGEHFFKTKMQTPQTQVMIMETGDMPYTAKNALLANIAGQILTARLIKNVREEMGAVYSISASGSLSRSGIRPASLGTSFPMKPELKDQVLSYIKQEIKNMETDVKEDELNPIKEYLVKSYTQNKIKNSAWLGGILGEMSNGVDTFHDNVETAQSITVQDVMDYMKALNGQGNYRVITLEPEE